MRRERTVVLGLLVVQLVIFLVSLPGFGIESRSFSAYATWAAPIFLVLTLLVFAFGVAGVVSIWCRARTAANLAIGQAVAAILVILLDLSQVAGPAPPTGPLVLGIAGLIVAVLEIGFGLRARR